jgi:hypothetical protein
MYITSGSVGPLDSIVKQQATEINHGDATRRQKAQEASNTGHDSQIASDL